MPKVPKWMANAMEKLFSGHYHPVTISKIEYLANELKKVTFEGDFSKVKKDFIAGNIIEFRVSDQDFRHYTPSKFDKSKGICEVMFYLHNKGIGSKWLSKLQEGDSVKLLGPGGKTKYKNDAKIHFVFGDESSMGMFEIFSSEAKKRNHNCFILAELDDSHKHWNDNLNVTMNVIPKNDLNSSQIIIDDFFKSLTIEKNDIAFYLTGNAKSIQSLMHLLNEKGISKKQIQSEPYWAENKKGL